MALWKSKIQEKLATHWWFFKQIEIVHRRKRNSFNWGFCDVNFHIKEKRLYSLRNSFLFEIHLCLHSYLDNTFNSSKITEALFVWPLRSNERRTSITVPILFSIVEPRCVLSWKLFSKMKLHHIQLLFPFQSHKELLSYLYNVYSSRSSLNLHYWRILYQNRIGIIMFIIEFSSIWTKCDLTAIFLYIQKITQKILKNVRGCVRVKNLHHVVSILHWKLKR